MTRGRHGLVRSELRHHHNTHSSMSVTVVAETEVRKDRSTNWIQKNKITKSGCGDEMRVDQLPFSYVSISLLMVGLAVHCYAISDK